MDTLLGHAGIFCENLPTNECLAPACENHPSSSSTTQTYTSFLGSTRRRSNRRTVLILGSFCWDCYLSSASNQTVQPQFTLLSRTPLLAECVDFTSPSTEATGQERLQTVTSITGTCPSPADPSDPSFRSLDEDADTNHRLCHSPPDPSYPHSELERGCASPENSLLTPNPTPPPRNPSPNQAVVPARPRDRHIMCPHCPRRFPTHLKAK